VGINFSRDGKVGNTIDSHRLVSYAERHGKQNEVPTLPSSPLLLIFFFSYTN